MKPGKESERLELEKLIKAVHPQKTDSERKAIFDGYWTGGVCPNHDKGKKKRVIDVMEFQRVKAELNAFRMKKNSGSLFMWTKQPMQPANVPPSRPSPFKNSALVS